MKSRLYAAAAVGIAALLAVSGCSSSGSGSSGGSGGSVTLHLFGADYSTGAGSTSTTSIWQAVATAFPQEGPEYHGGTVWSPSTGTASRQSQDFQSRNRRTPTSWKETPAPPYAAEGLIYPTSQIL